MYNEWQKVCLLLYTGAVSLSLCVRCTSLSTTYMGILLLLLCAGCFLPIFHRFLLFSLIQQIFDDELDTSVTQFCAEV